MCVCIEPRLSSLSGLSGPVGPLSGAVGGSVGLTGLTAVGAAVGPCQALSGPCWAFLTVRMCVYCRALSGCRACRAVGLSGAVGGCRGLSGAVEACRGAVAEKKGEKCRDWYKKL